MQNQLDVPAPSLYYASTTPIFETDAEVTLKLINQSSLVGKAEKYTHSGNYLQLSGNAQHSKII